MIDADVITRELVAPGSPGLEQIVACFGQDILKDTGELDRAALRKHIFSSPMDRKRLEAILHPMTRDAIKQRLSRITGPYCIISIPLLVESGWEHDVDRILVVDSPVEIQVQRTCERDGADREAVMAIIQTQADRETRLKIADDVICNDADLDTLARQVEQLHHKYLALAQRG